MRRRYRDVQCVDSQSKRALRPFHCQVVSSRPLSTLVCPLKPCLSWSVSPWGAVRSSYSQIPVVMLTMIKTCPIVVASDFKSDRYLCFPQCSGSCSEGVRERLVFCPEPHRCRATLKPNSTEPCRLKPCSYWKTEDWEQVSPPRRPFKISLNVRFRGFSPLNCYVLCAVLCELW